MRNQISIYLKSILAISVLVLIFSSCVPIKKQVLMQVPEDDSAKAEYLNNRSLTDYRLKSGNNLYVKIISANEDAEKFFNPGVTSSGNIYYDAAIYLTSYSVDDSGYVELPFLGKILAKGKTLNEFNKDVSKIVEIYLKNTMLVIKLVNYNITVVGEVKRAGQFKIYQDKINIFEVLGMAGDFTTYAKRDDVVIVRHTEKGSKVHHLDLLSDDILESKFYYLMPDDIVYVRPLRGKNFAYQMFPYALVISSISLILAIFSISK
jgi:polysaccharide export outer membrane protein